MSSTNSNNSNQVLQISKKLMEIIDNLLKYSLDNCLVFFFSGKGLCKVWVKIQSI